MRLPILSGEGELHSELKALDVWMDLDAWKVRFRSRCIATAG